MLRSLKKIRSFLFILSIFLLIYSSIKTEKTWGNNLVFNYRALKEINLNNLMKDLIEEDKKLVPKKIYNFDGTYSFRYKKRVGDQELSFEEIERRILLGSDFFKNDRESIKTLLTKINDLKIKNKLGIIESGALGLWVPKKDLIIIDYRAINMGSQIFLEILRHEAIHVAQSCFSNTRKNFPVRIGLPLEFSKDINLNLSHRIYSKNSKEVLNIEREAFTYSKIDGAAIKLLNRFCK